MSITYTWTIPTLVRVPTKTVGNTVFEDVVSEVHWRLTGKENENRVEIYGTFGLDINNLDSNSFVSFSDVNANIVNTWLTENLDVESCKTKVSDKIAEIVSPSVLNGLPGNTNITFQG